MRKSKWEPGAPVPRDELGRPTACAWREVVRSHNCTATREYDEVIEEVPVALVYNRISHAVMMASPADLEDFALGFSLGEGIVEQARDVHELEIRAGAQGVVIDMVIAARHFAALKQRKRNLAGRTGCGLCGLDSLATFATHATPAAPCATRATRVSVAAIDHALHQLPHWQPLYERTGASHGAAWVDPEAQIRCVREDVGRHNALDKLVGALARTGEQTNGGFALITSRASYEMVQKAAHAGITALVALSAPTVFAIQQAEATGMLLVGFARTGARVAYSHAERLDGVPTPALAPYAIM